VVEAVYQQTSRRIDEKDLTIPDIKAVGNFECAVVLHPEVTGTFTVVVQREKGVQAAKKK
jgi:large subunit ribosomal protein L9